MELKLITEPQNNNEFHDQKTVTGELQDNDSLLRNLILSINMFLYALILATYFLKWRIWKHRYNFYILGEKKA